MSSLYGPEQPEQPQQPPQGWPPPAPPAPAPPWPPAPVQPASSQPYPGQPYPGQPYSGPPYPGPPYPGQPYPGQPVSAQPYPGQPVSGTPYPPTQPFPAVASGVPWTPVPLPPPKKNGGKIAIIVTAVAVPVLALCGTVGYFFAQGVKQGIDAAASSAPSGSVSATPTPDINAVPAVGSCFNGTVRDRGFNNRAETNRLVGCDTAHLFETIASGPLTTLPTDPTDAQAGDLYGTCEQAAADFLGQPWGATYTWLVLSLPSSTAFGNGAHWYRCDLVLNGAINDMSETSTTGSLRDAVSPITCLDWTVINNATSIKDIVPGECSDVHNGELAGVLAMPANLDRSDDNKVSSKLSDLCEPVVLRFLGRSSLPSTLTFWFNWPADTRADGRLDQNVMCMVSAANLNKKFTASLKDIGSGKIPFAA